MHEIMREVKQTLTRKKISLIEAFKLIDSDSDGFVTVSEFEVGIDKIVKLSARAKQALFAYLDNLKIGMFDSERFSSVMSRITLEKH
jgi:Ca2+-binding EF-hand superfamily protein